MDDTGSSRRQRRVLAASGASEGAAPLQHSFWSSCLVRKSLCFSALLAATPAVSTAPLAASCGNVGVIDRSPTHPPPRQAGGAAGTAVDMSLFPLDTIKTR